MNSVASLVKADIRLAQPDDATALAEFAEQTFRETFASVNTVENMDAYCTGSFGAKPQRREILEPNYITILAESDGQLIAFAQMRINSHNTSVDAENPCEVYRIYVSSKYHGQGIAHQIMTDVLTRATQKGADSVWLGVWEENPRAIAFYEKRGFEIVGQQEFKLGDEIQRDLIMAVGISGQD